jgi:hypothetical protein
MKLYHRFISKKLLKDFKFAYSGLACFGLRSSVVPGDDQA